MFTKINEISHVLV